MDLQFCPPDLLLQLQSTHKWVRGKTLIVISLELLHGYIHGGQGQKLYSITFAGLPSKEMPTIT